MATDTMRRHLHQTILQAQRLLGGARHRTCSHMDRHLLGRHRMATRYTMVLRRSCSISKTICFPTAGITMPCIRRPALRLVR